MKRIIIVLTMFTLITLFGCRNNQLESISDYTGKNIIVMEKTITIDLVNIPNKYKHYYILLMEDSISRYGFYYASVYVTQHDYLKYNVGDTIP
jgi:hypothetical protein